MPEARISKSRRISLVWLVPLAALLLGAWLVFYTYQSQGPRIRLTFSTAEGIEAEKTKIKSRSVDVGIVESVHLADDVESVVVTALLEPMAEPLLREDTQFWVVRPRIGTSGISGLGTLLSGGYIELAPGKGAVGRKDFTGLETPPLTPASTPGLKLALVSERAGSISVGDPILHKGFRVGQVEAGELDVASQRMHYRAFVRAPYDELVTSTTRFWNASGLSVTAGAQGLEIHTGSLQALLVGGVAFGQPTGVPRGDPSKDGEIFELYPNFTRVNDQPFRHYVKYVVEFPQSVRGLQPGAPVEYRGVPIGAVESILVETLSESADQGGRAIPVLLRAEPGRVGLPDSEEGVTAFRRIVERGVPQGLRGSLATGSLLTGGLLVAFDYYPNEKPLELGTFDAYESIPTVASGLEGLEYRLNALLDKVNSLPLERTVANANLALAELDATLADARALIASRETQSLPASLEHSLAELDRTLQSLAALAQSIEQQPNSLIFPRTREPDPIPPVGSQ